MSKELEQVYKVVKQVEVVEDLFGELSSETVESKRDELAGIYRQLAKLLHPDRYPIDTFQHKLAAEIFPKVTLFYNRAKLKLEKGTYGERVVEDETEEIDFVVETKRACYHLRSTIAQGDLSTLYAGDYTNEQGEVVKIVAKVIADPEDNDLALNEARILRLLNQESSPYSKHLPKLIDQFKTSEGQMANIISYLDGYDLYSVRDRYREGVAEKHMVWMLSRLLSVLGYAHSKGILHANIEPAHLMIRPSDHNLFLIDWSYAVRKGEKFKVYNEDYSAPEVVQKKPPIPASDLYSVGKSMIFLLGGEVKTNSMPKKIEEKLKRLILFFVRESPLQRAQDAWEMYHYLRQLVVELWGERKFLKFEM
ncbi:MAG: hypothetical protein JNN15_05520 [Blastocatellia bacterium]|nr:hypothetical protein [Blastocatellia bacterium]